jgi:hypothetical protein
MKNPSYQRLAALALTGVVLAACADAPTSPSGLRGPVANVQQGKIRTLTVCAVGPAGNYGYEMSVNKNGSLTGTTTPYGLSYAIPAFGCLDVATLTQGGFVPGTGGDPLTVITVEQKTAPANTVLDGLIKTELDYAQAACADLSTFASSTCGIDTQEAGPSEPVVLNYYHGSVLTFWNSAVPTEVEGCTLTQGYWKTHTAAGEWPAGYLPGDMFFNSGKTWLQLFNTPPKGSAYVVLAHQYMAATLNLASGASMTGIVDEAYDNATAYFNGGSATSAQLIAWSETLDAYNNGLAGGNPAHCDD